MSGATEIQNIAISFANTAALSMNTFANIASGKEFASIDDPRDYLPKTVVPGYNGGQIAPPADFTLPAIDANPPTRPALSNIDVPQFVEVPQFTMAQPTITIPVAPNANLPSSPGQAPTFNTPVLPTAPTFALPVAPSFQAVAIPVAPNLVMPTFSASLPIDDIAEPSERFTFAEQAYSSVMLDALKAKLMADLSNGGYGIESSDEAALWDRAREREMRAGEMAIQDAARQMASRGFSIPPGALNGIIQAAQQAALEKVSTLSRDIALKRADMYVENRKFTIEQVKEVETTLIQYTGAMAERALNAAKSIVELGVAVFNARVARFNVRLESYKTQAQVYESLIRGASLQLEAYRTQVEGAKLEAETQRVHAEVYRIQVDSVQSLVNVYTSQINAANVLVGIERAKLDAFKTTVEAYTAQVGAKQVEFNMFEARIKGETAKLDAYKTAADVYGTTVAAYKTRAETSDVVLRAKLATENTKLEAYKADLSRYTAEMESARIMLTSALGKYSADVQKFSVLVSAEIQSSNENTLAARANAELATARAKMIGDYTVAKAGVLTEQARAIMTVNAGLSSAYGALGSSALSSAIGITSAAITS